MHDICVYLLFTFNLELVLSRWRLSIFTEFEFVLGVVNERIQEAHRNEDAPVMMLFPGHHTTVDEFMHNLLNSFLWNYLLLL